MDRVSQSTVLRHWLGLEQERTGADQVAVDALGQAEVMDRLLRYRPGAAAFIWRDSPVDWFAIELSREQFLGLQVVPGPEHLSWRALSPDNTIESVGERLALENHDPPSVPNGIDISQILALREAMPTGAASQLVLSTRRGCVPWSIADGNHRAVAKAIYLLDGGAYEPQDAYLGVGSNPIVAPLRQRFCGLARRLVPSSSGPVNRS